MRQRIQILLVSLSIIVPMLVFFKMAGVLLNPSSCGLPSPSPANLADSAFVSTGELVNLRKNLPGLLQRSIGVLLLGTSTTIWDCVTWYSKSITSPFESFDYRVHNATYVETAEHRKDGFDNVFHERQWGGKPTTNESIDGVSGLGSEWESSENARKLLDILIDSLKVLLKKDQISLLDVPTGNLEWMAKYLATRDDIIYTGYEIVSEIVEHHHRKMPELDIRQWDIVTTPPHQAFDIVLCRHMLMHLKSRDAALVLKHISESNSKYLLTTSFPVAVGSSGHIVLKYLFVTSID